MKGVTPLRYISECIAYVTRNVNAVAHMSLETYVTNYTCEKVRENYLSLAELARELGELGEEVT